MFAQTVPAAMDPSVPTSPKITNSSPKVCRAASVSFPNICFKVPRLYFERTSFKAPAFLLLLKTLSSTLDNISSRTTFFIFCFNSGLLSKNFIIFITSL